MQIAKLDSKHLKQNPRTWPRGMVKSLTVVPAEGAPAAAPLADLDMNLADHSFATYTELTAGRRTRWHYPASSRSDDLPALPSCAYVHCSGALSGRQRTNLVPWRKRPPLMWS